MALMLAVMTALVPVSAANAADDDITECSMTTQCRASFGYTGTPVQWTLPRGAFNVAIGLTGASGGNATGNHDVIHGGRQASMRVDLSAQSWPNGGDFTFNVGGTSTDGHGGYNGGGDSGYVNAPNFGGKGGGGGGATDVVLDGQVVAVAGGGGGAGQAGVSDPTIHPGGIGGDAGTDQSAGYGTSIGGGINDYTGDGNGGSGGRPGTSAAGGAGGPGGESSTEYHGGESADGKTGGSGIARKGGMGGLWYGNSGGGGGGGGWYGGGGGGGGSADFGDKTAYAGGGGGGGGSNYNSGLGKPTYYNYALAPGNGSAWITYNIYPDVQVDLSLSASTIQLPGAVTFDVNVTTLHSDGKPATGTVEIIDSSIDGTGRHPAFAGQTPVPVVAGKASLTVEHMGKGTYSVAAVFRSDDQYVNKQSSWAELTVLGIPSTVSFRETPSEGYIGDDYAPDVIQTDPGSVINFSVDPASAAVCSFQNGLVHYKAAGDCTIRVDEVAATIAYANGSATQTIPVTVAPAPAAPVFTASSPATSATVGSAYSYTFAASGFRAPIFWIASGDTLPAGLTLNGYTGVLSGTPTTPGTTTFHMIAYNPSGTVRTGPISLTVAPEPVAPVFTASSPAVSATVGSAYSYTFTASGTPAPTFAVASGDTLPAGLTLNTTTGVLSGTPTTPGPTTFRVVASNSAGTVTTDPIPLTVQAAPVLTAAAPPAATVGSAYSYTFTASGTPAPTFAVASGDTLPAGLTLNTTTGVLSGTPTTPGPTTFRVVASNSAGTLTTDPIPLTVQAAPVLTAAAPPGATVGSAYSYTFTASGTPAPTFAVASGDTLPAGLTLNTTTGVLSGTPTTPGPTTFRVVASNDAGTAATDPITLTVAPAPVVPPVFTAASPIPKAKIGSAYSYTFTASGTPAPTFAVASGDTLPAGLTLNTTTGVLSGTPTTPGPTTFRVVASNSAGTMTTGPITITVQAGSTTGRSPASTASAVPTATASAAPNVGQLAFTGSTGLPIAVGAAAILLAAGASILTTRRRRRR